MWADCLLESGGGAVYDGEAAAGSCDHRGALSGVPGVATTIFMARRDVRGEGMAQVGMPRVADLAPRVAGLEQVR